jgi:pSer/pThr/pTyr-binding forkhead associated (FHA) protein
MKLRLQITVSPRSAFPLEHDRADLYIGRDPACELHLQGEDVQNISWRHARIELASRGAYLTDLGSTNGTFVNGRRISRCTDLHVGDQIQLGRTGPRLHVVELELPASGSAPAVDGEAPVQPDAVPAPKADAAPPSQTRLMLRALQARQQWLLRGLALAVVGLLLVGAVVLVVFVTRPRRQTESDTPDVLASKYRDRVYFIKYAQLVKVSPKEVKAVGSTGSGILVANSKTRGLIATNLHVLNEALVDNRTLRKVTPESIPKELPFPLEVKSPAQLNFKPARWAAFHRELDMALLLVEMENATPGAVPIIRQDALRDGEPAVAIGYPLGRQLATTTGVISNPRGDADGLVYTSCAISSGNSGGPLFIQRRGRLAGLNTFALSRMGATAQNFNGAVPGEEIVGPLQQGRTDNWVWAPDLKHAVLELARMVPLKD